MKIIHKIFGKDIFSVYPNENSIQVAGVMINEVGAREVVYTENITLPENQFKNNILVNPAAVARKMQLRVKKIEAKNCILILPADQTFEFFFRVETPPPPPKKGAKKKYVSMDDMIEQKIRSNVPIPFEDLNYKYLVTTHGNQTVCSISAVASEIVEEYYDFLKQCKLKPVAIEPEYCSLLRNMYIKEGQIKGCIVIHVLPERISWFGLVNDHLVDSSIIDRKIKHVRSPGQILESDLDQSIESFDNFEKQNTKKVSTIYICSKTKKIPDDVSQAVESIGKKHSIPVKTIDRFKMVPETKRYAPSDFNICLGGALQTFEPQSFTMNFMEKNTPIKLH